MSLDHDFILVSAAEHSPADYSRFIRSQSAVRLHDDLLHYIGDSLKWIPTLNPAKDERGCGINFYGPTAILAEGAPIAARVVRAWAHLLGLSPPELVLTGSWAIEGDTSSGHFIQLRFERDRVVSALEQIASYCSRVADSKGEYFVLHLGI